MTGPGIQGIQFFVKFVKFLAGLPNYALEQYKIFSEVTKLGGDPVGLKLNQYNKYCFSKFFRNKITYNPSTLDFFSFSEHCFFC